MTTQFSRSSWGVILGVLYEELDEVWLKEGGGVTIAIIYAHDIWGSWIGPLLVN